MEKKRFELHEISGQVRLCDMSNDSVLDRCNAHSAVHKRLQEICDLLNSLHSENERLKAELANEKNRAEYFEREADLYKGAIPGMKAELLPFDINKALAGHPCVTRDGRKVLQIAHFPEAILDSHRVYALHEFAEEPVPYYEDGTFFEKITTGQQPSEADLFLLAEPEEMVTCWIYRHVMPNPNGPVASIYLMEIPGKPKIQLPAKLFKQ